ncbi:Membrane-bound lytic murein transglycosylase F (EC 4.2.2.n1) [hydrothermal vent metagenome]|uniref:Membrane-bound lytic murein transglycosylase F n=1 Tax=hydrothermal vent metagenome TaxID=652676 RepID=A0A3B0S0U1_9ZZZZ
MKLEQSGAWALSMALMLAILISGCEPMGPRQGSILREAQTRGVLRVVTTNAPTTYYEGRDGFAGFEYDLARAYGQSLGLKVDFLVMPTVEAVLQAVQNDQADLAAAGLSITQNRQEKMVFSPPYLKAVPVLVCRRGVRKITELKQLAGLRVALAKGSSFIDVLQQLATDDTLLAVPDIADRSVEGLLADVAQNRIDCTIADEHVFALQRRYQPMLEDRLRLGEGTPMGWVLGGGHSWRNASLHRDVEHWMQADNTRALIDNLAQRYFSLGETEFDYVDLSRLRRAMKTRLPKFRQAFEKAGVRYELPWTLLAAISWRESHWKSDATSRTGVRGLMMLTRVTAREQGVNDRLNPEQSIAGGARYLASLLRRLPEDIPKGQRIQFALAAYNMGWGHMMDARELVTRHGDDANQWNAVAEVLPELEQAEVYKTLPRGYARGREGQAYVAAVMNFADIIEKAHAPAIIPEPVASE